MNIDITPAIEHIDASPCGKDYVYYAAEATRRDAYSHWCAGTTSEVVGLVG